MEEVNELIPGKIDIIQNNKFFKFGTDSVLLANFTRARSGDLVADFGCGSGVIPLLLAFKKEFKKVIGLEIQSELVKLARRNVKMNDLDNIIEIREADFTDSRKYIEPNIFDIVISNPPYLKLDGGMVSDNRHKAVARHEIHATLKDLIREASLALKNGGSFYLVYRSTRMAEAISLMKEYDLAPKRLRPVYPRKDSYSDLFLLEARRGGGIGLKIEPPIIIYREGSQEYTAEVKKMYGIDKDE